MQGRTAFYGAEHVARLELIAELQQQGFNLASIRTLVTGGPSAPSAAETVSFYRTALGPWLTEAPEEHLREDVAAQFGIAPDDELLRRLQVLRLLEPLPGGRVRVLNPTILRVGRDLAGMGFTPAQLLSVLRVLLQHSRAVADAFVDMFLSTHWTAYVDDGMPPERLPELSRMIRELQPLATQAVVAAFQQEMSQATGAAFERVAREQDQSRPAAG
jgi:DNA-binding transcriptional MerR regulator